MTEAAAVGEKWARRRNNSKAGSGRGRYDDEDEKEVRPRFLGFPILSAIGGKFRKASPVFPPRKFEMTKD